MGPRRSDRWTEEEDPRRQRDELCVGSPLIHSERSQADLYQSMHNHPITGKQLSALREWNWFEVLQPMEKTLACGDTGSGAMMDWREIVQITEARLGLSKE